MTMMAEDLATELIHIHVIDISVMRDETGCRTERIFLRMCPKLVKQSLQGGVEKRGKSKER